MTADANLVCRRCGFTNVPGDTFCGSCGAFLEWEGEVAADGSPISPPPPGTGPVADVPSIPPRPDPATPPVGPAAGAGAAAAPDGDLVRCPACGVANAASRTFCQACGAKLGEGAGRVGAVSQDQIIAAVNAPNKPITVTTTTIRRPEPEEGSGSGGILKWVAIMAVLGVIVGVVVVLGGNLLRGEGPQSGASPAPSSSAAAGQSGAPTGSAETPSGSPTPRPPNTELTLTSANASSWVGNRDKFAPDKAIDGDPDTCWQEGGEDEAGEWIEVEFAPSTVSALQITNGYNASKALYKGNRRLKDIEISIDGGEPIPFRLEDTGEPQPVPVKNVDGATTVRITIVSTYDAKETAVHGTPFDDAALGEIVVMGVPGS